MAKIEYDKTYKKHFRKRIASNQKLVIRYQERLELFLTDRKNAVLKDHKLIGSLQGTRAFNITGDIRVVYIEIESNHFVFLDIGTHPQIYGM